jgi:hypothetical protein
MLLVGFWVIPPCYLVGAEECAASTCRMEAASYSETLVPPTTTQSVITGGPSSKSSLPCDFGFCITLPIELISLVTE